MKEQREKWTQESKDTLHSSHIMGILKRKKIQKEKYIIFSSSNYQRKSQKKRNQSVGGNGQDLLSKQVSKQ